MTTDQSNATDVPADAARAASSTANGTTNGGSGSTTNGSTTNGSTTPEPTDVTPISGSEPAAKTEPAGGTATEAGPEAVGKAGSSTDQRTTGMTDASGKTDATGKPGATADATDAAGSILIDLGTVGPAGAPPATTTTRSGWRRFRPPGRTARAEAARPAGPEDGGTGGEPVDKWSAFGPAPEPVLGPVGRIRRAVGRTLVHEWTLATLVGLALAVALTWPTLRYPQHTIPQDIWDPTLQAWQISWSGHILLSNPALLWQSNAFYPESWSFAFSDTLLGYAPAGMIGDGPMAAVVRYNIIFVLAHALAAIGAYALVRQLGGGKIGAAVAAVAYAYPPWLLSQAGHLHVLSNGGIPLALAMLARGHGWSLRHGFRPERRHAGWALAGWLVAAWQLSLGFGIGLPFAYFLALIMIVAGVTWFVRRTWVWKERRPLGIRLLLADFWGAVIFAGIGALLAIPYFKVAELHPNAKRTVGDLALYSPPPSGFVVAPKESLLWGGLHDAARAGLPWAPENTLLPGFALYALALAGLFFSIWTVRQRLLLLAAVLATGILAMGTEFFGGRFSYLPLFENLPGWDGLRTPGRLMIWTTLLLGILAAGAVSAFAKRARDISAAERVPPRPGPWLRLATLLPLALVLVEGLNSTPTPIVPAQPAALRTVDGPVLVLPSDQGTDQHVMLWSTSRFQDVVNGGSGFTPDSLAEVRELTQSFPDQPSVDYLRGLGVKTVVLLKDRIAGTPWEQIADQPVEQFGIQREDRGDTIVFQLAQG